MSSFKIIEANPLLQEIIKSSKLKRRNKDKEYSQSLFPLSKNDDTQEDNLYHKIIFMKQSVDEGMKNITDMITERTEKTKKVEFAKSMTHKLRLSPKKTFGVSPSRSLKPVSSKPSLSSFVNLNPSQSRSPSVKSFTKLQNLKKISLVSYSKSFRGESPIRLMRTNTDMLKPNKTSLLTKMSLRIKKDSVTTDSFNFHNTLKNLSKSTTKFFINKTEENISVLNEGSCRNYGNEDEITGETDILFTNYTTDPILPAIDKESNCLNTEPNFSHSMIKKNFSKAVTSCTDFSKRFSINNLNILKKSEDCQEVSRKLTTSIENSNLFTQNNNKSIRSKLRKIKLEAKLNAFLTKDMREDIENFKDNHKKGGNGVFIYHTKDLKGSFISTNRKNPIRVSDFCSKMNSSVAFSHGDKILTEFKVGLTSEDVFGLKDKYKKVVDHKFIQNTKHEKGHQKIKELVMKTKCTKNKIFSDN
jgi:hypothetical protein